MNLIKLHNKLLLTFVAFVTFPILYVLYPDKVGPIQSLHLKKLVFLDHANNFVFSAQISSKYQTNIKPVYHSANFDASHLSHGSIQTLRLSGDNMIIFRVIIWSCDNTISNKLVQESRHLTLCPDIFGKITGLGSRADEYWQKWKIEQNLFSAINSTFDAKRPAWALGGDERERVVFKHILRQVPRNVCST